MVPPSRAGAGQVECETKQRIVLVSQQRVPPPGTAPQDDAHCESLVHVMLHEVPPPVSGRGGFVSVGTLMFESFGTNPVSRGPMPVSPGRMIPASMLCTPVSVACPRPDPLLQPMAAPVMRSEKATTEMLASFMAVW